MNCRSIFIYAVILSKRGSKAHPINPIPSTSHSSSSQSTTEGMDCKNNSSAQQKDLIGGGAINEKPRLYPNRQTSEHDEGDGRGINGWNPSANLSHLLHALVGLDRYPNYLGRFRDLADIDLVENALESRLRQVRQQRLEIIERRKAIHQLVRKYMITNEMGTSSEVGEKDSFDCIHLWHHHPSLSPPKTWSELRERKVLHEKAFKVAYQSISKASLNTKRKAKSDKSQKQNIDMLPTVEDILEGKVNVDLDASLLENWMSQELFDVYSLPLLTNEVRILHR